ncbi:MAG: hypothetical protein M3Q55_09325, partial [Acidobacteriota bacterium]|nr:hypothetical protein [Acidobacteriota bacterium]
VAIDQRGGTMNLKMRDDLLAGADRADREPPKYRDVYRGVDVVDCEACDATGGDHECPVCQGRGFVRDPKWLADGEEPFVPATDRETEAITSCMLALKVLDAPTVDRVLAYLAARCGSRGTR